MLFSATQTTKVDDLVRISFQNKPIYIGVHDKTQYSTVTGLEQGFVVVPSERRFLLLFTFLKKNLKKKIIVFMSSCNAVKFYAELLNFVDINVMDLHGKNDPIRYCHCSLASGEIVGKRPGLTFVHAPFSLYAPKLFFVCFPFAALLGNRQAETT